MGSTSIGYNKVLFAPISSGSNAYLAKFSANGDLLWGKQFANVAHAVCVDSGGNVYVGGGMNGDPADNTGPIGSGFVAKFDGNGNQLWLNSIGSNGENIRSIALDTQGNLLATGVTQVSLFGPNAGDTDIFLIKYDTNGNVLWQEQEGTPDADDVYSLCVGNNGYAYLAGETQGSLFAANAGGRDAFIQRVDPMGQTALAKPQYPSPYKPLQFAWAGLTIHLTYPPVLANKQPYVYAGYLCSGIPGAKVKQTATKQVVIEGPSKQVIITPNSLTYQINGKPHKMSAKPILVSSNCYVPLDVMKAVLPYPVHYEAKTQTIRFDPPQPKQASK